MRTYHQIKEDPFTGKPRTYFCANEKRLMKNLSFFIRLRYFIMMNNESIIWWIENGSDIWDMLQPVINYLSSMLF